MNDNPELKVVIEECTDSTDLVLRVESQSGTKLVMYPAWTSANVRGQGGAVSREAWEKLKADAVAFAFTRGL